MSELTARREANVRARRAGTARRHCQGHAPSRVALGSMLLGGSPSRWVTTAMAWLRGRPHPASW
jgi:hypothetical protein